MSLFSDKYLAIYPVLWYSTHTIGHMSYCNHFEDLPMNDISFAFAECDPDPMTDLFAIEAEKETVRDYSYLCTVDTWED